MKANERLTNLLPPFFSFASLFLFLQFYYFIFLWIPGIMGDGKWERALSKDGQGVPGGVAFLVLV